MILFLKEGEYMLDNLLIKKRTTKESNNIDKEYIDKIVSDAINKDYGKKTNKHVNHHVWELQDKVIVHKTYGEIDVTPIVPYDEFEIVAIIPINVEYCFFLFVSNYKNKKFLYLKDVRFNNNKLTSSFMYKFYASGNTMRTVRSAINSCKGETGTMSVGFFLRLLYSHGINSFSSSFNKKK